MSQPFFLRSPWLVVPVYLCAYVVLDGVSFIHPVSPVGITPWNPPPGLSLALLLLGGLRYWPVLPLALLLAEVLVRDVPAPLPWLIASSFAVGFCYTGIALGLQRLVPSGTHLGSLSGLTAFLATLIPGTALAALAYVGIFTLCGAVGGEAFVANFLRFWVGDAIGVMVLTPFLLIHFGQGAGTWRARPSLGEAAAQAGAVLLALWLMFGIEITDEYKMFYLLFLPLTWIAMCGGIHAATLALLGIQGGLIGALQWSGQRTATVVEFQLLMAALTITGLYLGLAVSSRREAEAKLQRREAELNQALRLAAAGEMTSALAHELGQPLSAITSYLRACQVMLGDAAAHPMLAPTMDKVVSEAGRAAQVVRSLREFYRGGEIRFARLDLEALLRNALDGLRLTAEGHGITLELSVKGTLPAAWAERIHVETVLHNLLANALDALHGRYGGKITVSAAGEAAGWIKVCVADDGPGVSAEIADNLFQHFVTSKPEGMGLGLAIARSLIEAHGGHLSMENLPAGGAQFCFTLPAQP